MPFGEAEGPVVARRVSHGAVSIYRRRGCRGSTAPTPAPVCPHTAEPSDNPEPPDTARRRLVLSWHMASMTLDNLGDLPKRCRSCVFWELAPQLGE